MTVIEALIFEGKIMKASTMLSIKYLQTLISCPYCPVCGAVDMENYNYFTQTQPKKNFTQKIA